MELPTISLVDVEAKDTEGKTVIVKTVKATKAQPDYEEYATKEQLEAIRDMHEEKLIEIARRLALFK